jgi:hypothetical protein
MKVNAKVVGYGPDPETINIIVEFSGPTETMTLTVIVPNEGDEAALNGIARGLRAPIRRRPILGSPLTQRGREPRSPFALTAPPGGA